MIVLHQYVYKLRQTPKIVNSLSDNKSIVSRLLLDIRFWIVLSFIIRLYAITNPPLEVGHNWRQTDGLMIARNFYEHDADIFYPTVDVGGERTGIVGCEFPILNYILYLVSLVFGYNHWHGRLIVLLTSCIGVYFFHKIVFRRFGEQAAFNSAILLMFSFWFSYSRKFIPDIFGASLCIIALYFALTFLERGDWWRVLLFFILASLGCLSKILAATILTVLAFPLLESVWPMARKFALAGFSALILIVVCAWYFFWVPRLNATYGFPEHFFMGQTFKEGATAIWENLPKILKRFYDTPMKYTGFATFLFSIFMVIRNRKWLILQIFLLPFLSFLIILLKTGAAVIGDTYYVLTVIVPMTFIAGYGLTYIKNRKVVAFILLVVAVENISAQIYDFRLREPWKSLQNLEAIMDEVSQRDDKIVIGGDWQQPTVMYFAHRKGWVALDTQLQDSTFLNDIAGKGCKYALITKKLYGDINLNRPVVHDSEYFKIYKLN